LRVLVVAPGPDFSVADVYRGWAEGFAAVGCETRLFELDRLLDWYSGAHMKTLDGDEWVRPYDDEQAKRLAAGHIKSECYTFWPDLVVIISGFYMYETLVQIMGNRGHKLALICTESPYEDDAQLIKAQWGFDAVALNDPTNVDVFAETFGDRAIYTPHCYRPEVHHPGPSTHSSDVAFVGTGFPSRQAFMNRVDWTGIDLALAGNWQHTSDDLTRRVIHDLDDCLDNVDTANVYRGTKASFNLYRTENNGGLIDAADGWAMGPREVELAACGTWFARQSRPESDEVLSMLPTFNSPEELGEQLRWALTHPDQRQLAAERARAAVADRTFPNNAKRLLQALGV
jgi:spore maturation protein CgeB